jgi:hypothetical protein
LTTVDLQLDYRAAVLLINLGSVLVSGDDVRRTR